MGRRKDLSPELIKEFYATVYFHPDEAHTITWMSATTVCSATLGEFVTLLVIHASFVILSHVFTINYIIFMHFVSFSLTY